MEVTHCLSKVTLLGAAAAAMSIAPSYAKDVKSVVISVGSLGNPGFVITSNTATRLI